MKFDIEKIKRKLDRDKEKADEAKASKFAKKDNDISSDILAKVKEAGDHKFRAVPYIHNEDCTSDPFPERFYHFGRRRIC